MKHFSENTKLSMSEMILDAVRDQVDRTDYDSLVQTINNGEDDQAIAMALYWSTEGSWKIPKALFDPIREWGDDENWFYSREAAEQALVHAGQPGLTTKH